MEVYYNKKSTVYTTEYKSKRNPTVKPQWAQPETHHQTLTLSSIGESSGWNRHRVSGPTRWCAIKEESKISNCDWVDHQACSPLQYINIISNLLVLKII